MDSIIRPVLLSIIMLSFSVNGMAYNDTQFARLFVTKKCYKCDLYKANFSGSDLTDFDFKGSNLILANFQNATLLGVNFENANLTGANFTGAVWVDGSVCQSGSYGKCKKRKKQ